MAILTNHGAKRLHERAKVKKKDLKATAQEALVFGLTHGETKGNLYKYITKLYFEHGNANNIRIYKHYVYLFDRGCLITVFALPANLCKVADELNRKKGSKSQ